MAAKKASGPEISQQALNRALLARQQLLERVQRPALEVVTHLVGMQAQVPTQPYIGLWSRIEGFDPTELEAAVSERRALRMLLMRGTLHLATAEDALALRPVLQPVLERGFKSASPYGRRSKGADLAAVLAAGKAFIATTRTFSELKAFVAERWPDQDAEALAHGVRYAVPHVQPPPRGLWRKSSAAALIELETFLGAKLAPATEPDALVARYLAAFGPASTQDVQAWSGLTRLQPVLERLRPGLVTFTDERGRELFDVPDAPQPDPDVPAPVRFLPEYDNVLLGHADRSRMFDTSARRPADTLEQIGLGTVLVDGRAAAVWRLAEEAKHAVVRIRPYAKLGKRQLREMLDEAQRLARFIAEDADSHDVSLEAP